MPVQGVHGLIAVAPRSHYSGSASAQQPGAVSLCDVIQLGAFHEFQSPRPRTVRLFRLAFRAVAARRIATGNTACDPRRT